MTPTPKTKGKKSTASTTASVEPASAGSDTQLFDPDSEKSLKAMGEAEEVLSQRIPAVQTVLIVLSSRGMVFDRDSLAQKVKWSYPNAQIFFYTTRGKRLGPKAPKQVDLLLDFTGPGQRQGFLYPRKLRRMARFAVGRNAGYFRKRIYDRVFDETVKLGSLPKELLQKERVVQRKLLALAGVALVQSGTTPEDLGKKIALDLPPMQKL